MLQQDLKFIQLSKIEIFNNFKQNDFQTWKIQNSQTNSIIEI